MTDLNRVRELAGFHPKRDLITELKASKAEMIAGYDKLIKQVENGNQVDEGFFTSLTAALKTVGQVTKAGAKAAAEKAAKLSNNLKQVYLDNKAQAELKNMIDSIARLNNTLGTIEKEAPTVLTRDSEVKTSMGLLKDVLVKVIDQLSARIAVPAAANEGREVTVTDIEKVLQESAERIAAELDEAVTVTSLKPDYMKAVTPEDFTKDLDSYLKTLSSADVFALRKAAEAITQAVEKTGRNELIPVANEKLKGFLIDVMNKAAKSGEDMIRILALSGGVRKLFAQKSK